MDFLLIGAIDWSRERWEFEISFGARQNKGIGSSVELSLLSIASATARSSRMPFEERQVLMASNLKLFLEARSLWPLDLGLVITEISQGEFLCKPSLVNLYRHVEDQIGPTDEWKKIAVWSFHQALWELAHRAHSAGVDIVYPRDVQRSDFDRMVLDNLSGADWADMRREYLGNSDETAPS